MCYITKKSKLKIFTGWKAVYVVDGKYYSFWTNLEYEVGKVKPQKVKSDGTVRHKIRNTIVGLNYNKTMYGKTGVFKKKKDAERVYFIYENVLRPMALLKITISGDLYNGFIDVTSEEPVVLGNYIESIERIYKINKSSFRF
jgi:hypothetical protein